ncbi:hypothetical protein [Natrinema salsiterrestre]|uniref:Uncharacterized protein n=1 Tax=Natrinema salsiterrestre TaxID=2950540 RepID=A0A9Q4L2R1_9EURY|nr:hypothetical protein [Natrinema salsiterrestre]MDF9746544.1 hypothetical protein [Natrinema salsiterrestre]
MTRPSRRTVLCGAGSILALSAGCLSDDTGDESNGNGNGNGDSDDNSGGNGDSDEGSTDGDDTDGESTPPEKLAGHETHAFQSPDRSESPDASLLLERTGAEDWLDEREEPPDELSEFVEATDFETSVLVPLEAGAPNPCHGMALESIGIEDGEDGDDALALEAAVREESDDDEACITQEVTVGRLVRATFDSERLTAVSASIVDRNGQSHGIGIASDSASASASDSEE